MNFFWKSKSENLGVYKETELMERTGLNYVRFKKLLELEVYRYKTSLLQKGKEYYASRLKEDPLITKYGNIPRFPNHPNHHAACIFNNKSGVYLEKMWSSKNKYNEGKNLPFDFIFDTN